MPKYNDFELDLQTELSSEENTPKLFGTFIFCPAEPTWVWTECICG